MAFSIDILKTGVTHFFGKTQTCLPISSGTLIHDLSQLPYQSGVIAVYLENISLIIFYIIQISFFYQDFDFGIWLNAVSFFILITSSRLLKRFKTISLERFQDISNIIYQEVHDLGR